MRDVTLTAKGIESLQAGEVRVSTRPYDAGRFVLITVTRPSALQAVASGIERAGLGAGSRCWRRSSMNGLRPPVPQ